MIILLYLYQFIKGHVNVDTYFVPIIYSANIEVTTSSYSNHILVI